MSTKQAKCYSYNEGKEPRAPAKPNVTFLEVTNCFRQIYYRIDHTHLGRVHKLDTTRLFNR